MQPIITVLTATYNRPQLLKEAVQSILNQTFSHFELIVINDGGQDVNEVLEAFHDPRIVYLNLPQNHGKAYALNRGLEVARSEYVAYLDDDDHFYPHHLETLLMEIQMHPEVDLVYSDFEEVNYQKDAQDQRIEIRREVLFSKDFDRKALLRENYIPHPTVLHGRDLLLKYGGFEESLPCLIDWELFRRLAFYCEFRHIQQITGEYFINRTKGDHITNLTTTQPEVYLTYLHLIRRKLPPRPWTYVDETEFLLDERLKNQSAASDGSLQVSIIIPVRNKLEFTRQCLESIQRTDPAVSHEIIVVDNASDDGSREFLEDLAARRIITYLQNDTPRHFAASCNQGASLARGNYLLFLNNDTIAFPGWLEELYHTAISSPEVGAVGAKLLYPDHTIQHAGVAFRKFKRANAIGPYHIFKRFPAQHPAVNKVREFNVVTGACLMTPKTLFVDLDGFDERYINCYEDVDYCLKLRAQGYKVIYNPKAELMHFEGQTLGRNDNVGHSWVVMQSKWGTRLQPDDMPYLQEEGMIVEENDQGLYHMCNAEELQQWRDAISQVIELQQWDLAEEEIARYSEYVGTNNADILIMQGHCAFKKSYFNLAKASFSKVLQFDRANTEAAWGLTQIALAEGRRVEARTRLRRLLADFPEDARKEEWRKVMENV